MNRREFLRTAGGATAAAAVAAGPVAAQEARPDWGGWLQGVDGGFRDARGESAVTVEVGAQGNGGSFAFSPAGLWVDPGTTVTWEWTGQGGGHSVVAEEGASFDSGDPVAEAGATFEHTFEETGITTYFCEPHRSLGMKGAVAVGDDVPTQAGTPTATATPTPGGTPTATAGGDGGGGGGPTETVITGPGGNLVFDPEKLTIEPGTTVRWEWESDNHNIVVESQPDGANWEGTAGPPSKTYDTGHTYEFTFQTLGTYEYFCQPHKSAGMVGTVEVVENAGGSGGGGGEVEPEEMGVPIQAHFVGIGAVLSVLIALVFTFFQLKYGESPHAKGGN